MIRKILCILVLPLLIPNPVVANPRVKLPNLLVCVQPSGALRVKQKCGRGEIPASLNTITATGQQGPQGAQGPVGVQGPQGPQGPIGLPGGFDSSGCYAKMGTALPVSNGFGIADVFCNRIAEEFVLNDWTEIDPGIDVQVVGRKLDVLPNDNLPTGVFVETRSDPSVPAVVRSGIICCKR